jgi:hypothetical protein
MEIQEPVLKSITHVMRLDGDERDKLKALVEGADWARMGTSAETPNYPRASNLEETAL